MNKKRATGKRLLRNGVLEKPPNWDLGGFSSLYKKINAYCLNKAMIATISKPIVQKAETASYVTIASPPL